MTNDADYIKELENTIEAYMGMYSEPYAPDALNEDIDWAGNKTDEIINETLKDHSSQLGTFPSKIIGRAFIPLIATMRKQIKQETVFGKAACCENRRLRRLLKENGISYD